MHGALHKRGGWKVRQLPTLGNENILIINFNVLDTDLEAVLILSGAIIPPERPLPSENRGGDHDIDEDMSDDESASRMRSSLPRTSTTGPRRQNVRGSAKANAEGDDSDFDL